MRQSKYSVLYASSDSTTSQPVVAQTAPQVLLRVYIQDPKKACEVTEKLSAGNKTTSFVLLPKTKLQKIIDKNQAYIYDEYDLFCFQDT